MANRRARTAIAEAMDNAVNNQDTAHETTTPPPEEQQPQLSPTEKMQADLKEVKDGIRIKSKAVADLQASVKGLKRKLKYRPNNEELQAELDAALDALAETEGDLEDLQLEMAQIEHAMRGHVLAQQLAEMRKEADEIKFGVPMDDPIVGLNLLSAIAESLQYQFLSGRSYYLYLTNQAYTRNDEETGRDRGFSAQDMVSPETGYDAITRLEEVREQRRHLQILRMAVERQFHQELKHLPDNAPYRPKLLRRSDEEVLKAIEEGKERKRERAREQAEAVRTANGSFALIEDSIYRPRMSAIAH